MRHFALHCRGCCSASTPSLRRAHAHRGLHLGVINLRYLIGFAFVPAGLKKVLDQPFTDPANHGRFHDFLHAFHATGGFFEIQSIGRVLAPGNVAGALRIRAEQQVTAVVQLFDMLRHSTT